MVYSHYSLKDAWLGCNLIDSVFLSYRGLGMTSGESLAKYVHGDLNRSATLVSILNGKIK